MTLPTDTDPSRSHAQPVSVSLRDLETSEVSFDALENAFGPSSLGILIVKDLPAEFVDLRKRLLLYSSYLANLPSEQLERLENPSSNYLSGWSHGKEALKPGQYDTLKGSYYVNCAFYQGQDLASKPHPLSDDFPEFTAPNLWPEDNILPGFRQTFEELCTLIIDTAVLVARACDRYAQEKIADYEPNYLEQVVKSSVITKARLLHYFPREASKAEEADDDSWCATHIDHGCLTGLTSAMYVDEAANAFELLPNYTSTSSPPPPPPPLPFLPGPPDSSAGLYIHARNSEIIQVSIPPDHLAFQTGEALQLITQGKFRAVPHFVKAQSASRNGRRVARNTLAVFTQPDLMDVVDRERQITFGQFSREVMGRFG